MNNPYIDRTLIGIDSAWDQIMRFRNDDQQNFKEVIRQTLIGQKIDTNYNHGATYIIADILWDKNPKITFPDPKNHNQEMSFAKYFKRKYGLEIKDMEQPMIVGVHECSNFPILLVPELCSMDFPINDELWKEIFGPPLLVYVVIECPKKQMTY